MAHSTVTARGIAMSHALKAQRVQELLVAMLQVEPPSHTLESWHASLHRRRLEQKSMQADFMCHPIVVATTQHAH
jgi:hypothetical protein